MSHYSDIGFIVDRPEDIRDIFGTVTSKKYGSEKSWDVSVKKFLIKTNISYHIYNLGQARYCLKLDDSHHKILNLSLGHNNEKLSHVIFDSKAKPPKDADVDFASIKVLDEEGIPFWFSCLNIDLVQPNAGENIDIKIACFANSVEFKEKSERGEIGEEVTLEEAKAKFIENMKKEKHIPLADEGYISYWMSDPSYATLSGIITDIMKRNNIITTREYYEVHADCLGLKLALLIDPEIIEDKTFFSVGNVVTGEFWNTCFIVKEGMDDNFD